MEFDPLEGVTNRRLMRAARAIARRFGHDESEGEEILQDRLSALWNRARCRARNVLARLARARHHVAVVTDENIDALTWRLWRRHASLRSSEADLKRWVHWRFLDRCDCQARLVSIDAALRDEADASLRSDREAQLGLIDRLEALESAHELEVLEAAARAALPAELEKLSAEEREALECRFHDQNERSRGEDEARAFAAYWGITLGRAKGTKALAALRRLEGNPEESEGTVASQANRAYAKLVKGLQKAIAQV